MFWGRNNISGEYMKFKEFCLSESFRPLFIEYGTDLSNREWYSDEEQHWTFIKYEKYFYVVVVDIHGDVGFATSEVFYKKIFNKWKVIEQTFDFEERKTSTASKVFSYVMFVILKGLEEFNINEFKFSGQHAALGEIYKRVVNKNKYFMKAIEEARFYFDREEDGEFYFRRKEI